MEKWIKWAIAAEFIIVGIYYIIIVYGPMVGIGYGISAATSGL
jgi:hypothetical protein